MINEEYFQLWKGLKTEIDSWEEIIKTYLETYLKTQDTQYLKLLIEGAQILISKKEKEDEYYKKAFI